PRAAERARRHRDFVAHSSNVEGKHGRIFGDDDALESADHDRSWARSRLPAERAHAMATLASAKATSGPLSTRASRILPDRGRRDPGCVRWLGERNAAAAPAARAPRAVPRAAGESVATRAGAGSARARGTRVGRRGRRSGALHVGYPVAR